MIPLVTLLLAASGEPSDLRHAAEAGEVQRIREAFTEANRVYREAADAEGEKREKLYREAARRYAEIAFLARHRSNGHLLYNLGNARFRLGEYGRAIAAYRRAERLLPRHAATRRNLELARQNAPGGGAGPSPHPAAAAFFFWHYAMSLAEAEAAAALFLVGLFAALSVRLFARDPWRRRLRTAAIALGFLAGVFILSSSAKLAARRRPWAVVTADAVGVKSEPAGRAIELFPLREGAEVRVLRRAGDWTRIEAARDRRGWVETPAVEVLP